MKNNTVEYYIVEHERRGCVVEPVTTWLAPHGNGIQFRQVPPASMIVRRFYKLESAIEVCMDNQDAYILRVRRTETPPSFHCERIKFETT